MENLSMFNTKMREKRDIEEYNNLVIEINKNIEKMMQRQQYILEEQEQIKIDNMDTKELLKLVLEEQIKTTEQINKLLEGE